jgi:hypothetical protein
MTDTSQEPRGKGRPTPKRSEREAARRKPLVQPRTRESVKASRSEAAEARRRQREALRSGDERHYPPIAAGPERALVRDVIDRRRPFWLLALPVWALGAVLSLMASPVARLFGSFTLPLVVGLLLADLVTSRRSVRRALREAFPGGTREPEKVLVWYGTARNMQFRRSRLPRPRVEPGRR